MPTKAYSAHWVAHAPWAHPLWSSYVLALVDLTTVLEKPAVKFATGMTHEFSLWALNPELDHQYPHGKLSTTLPEAEITLQQGMLSPPNYVYQFVAKNDEYAEKRISGYYSRILNRTISPDTDFRKMWDQLFQDGISGRDYSANQKTIKSS